MKATAYMRIAKSDGRKGYNLAATLTPNSSPLYTTTGVALPTVAFAVVFDLPDAMFNRAAEVLAEVTVQPEDAEIAASVKELVK